MPARPQSRRVQGERFDQDSRRTSSQLSLSPKRSIRIIIMEHLAELSNEVVPFSPGLLQLARFLVCSLGQWPQELVMILDHLPQMITGFYS